MSETFSVGEIAVAYGWETNPEFNGCAVEVIGGLEARHPPDASLTYLVRMPNGLLTRTLMLRKRPSSMREQTSTWNDLIVWRPKETVHV